MDTPPTKTCSSLKVHQEVAAEPQLQHAWNTSNTYSSSIGPARRAFEIAYYILLICSTRLLIIFISTYSRFAFCAAYLQLLTPPASLPSHTPPSLPPPLPPLPPPPQPTPPLGPESPPTE